MQILTDVVSKFNVRFLNLLPLLENITKISFRPLKEHLSKCGYGLQPYCGLIPGGVYGSFFQEMQDLFYYMQIISERSNNQVVNYS